MIFLFNLRVLLKEAVVITEIIIDVRDIFPDIKEVLPDTTPDNVVYFDVICSLKYLILYSYTASFTLTNV